MRPLVVWRAVVSLHPCPGHEVRAGGIIERVPQIGVLAALPALRHRVHEVLAVADDFDLARLFECSERHQRGGQFHSVVRGMIRAAVEFLAMFAGAQHDPPPTNAGVWFRASVRVGYDFCHLLNFRLVDANVGH